MLNQAIPRDTTLEAVRVQTAIYQRMGMERRSQLALDMIEFSRQLAESGIRLRHPEYTDGQVRLAEIRLRLGDELFRKVYPGEHVMTPRGTMTETSRFLAKIVDLLDKAQIPYMVAGSVASIAYAEPRTTQDVDVIIAPSAEQLESFLRSLDSQEYYVSPEAAREAFADNSMFNVIDFESGWKVDLIFRKSRAYSIEEFRRRVVRKVWQTELSVVTPEDSILSKLDWRKDSRSERQYEDAVKVARAMWATLDFDYLRKWAGELGLADDLEQVVKDADFTRTR